MLRFVLLYGTTLILLVVVFSAFVRPKPKLVYKQATIDNVVDPDQIRQMQAEIADRDTQLSQLHALVSQLNSPDSAAAAGSETQLSQIARLQSEIFQKNTMITELEGQLKTALTSIPQPATDDHKEVAQLRDELDKKTRELAAARKRNTGKPLVTATSADSREIQRLRNEVSAANRKIASLQSRANTTTSATNSASNNASNSAKVGSRATNDGSTAAGRAANDGSTAADLQRRNDNLVKGFNTLQTQMGLLQKQYNLTKAENNRLKDQVRNNTEYAP